MAMPFCLAAAFLTAPWRWRLPLPGSVASPWRATEICVRSVCVDSTTIVSVRVTPSIRRIVLMSSLERRSVVGFDLQQHRVLAGDVMAFENVVESAR